MNCFRMPQPEFGSRLTDLVLDLERLRCKLRPEKIPPMIFSQLKGISRRVEGICSARIEGNTTSLADMIEIRPEDESPESEAVREVENIVRALIQIDDLANGLSIDEEFLSNVHRMVVDGLPPPKREGDITPGEYRRRKVSIVGSNHAPPDFRELRRLMRELIAFINEADPPKYDFIKIAMAHHRFVWAHPFSNGNGRVARLLTYALIRRKGFGTEAILAPSRVFSAARAGYYRYLSEADSMRDEDTLAWCEYFLAGLKTEIETADRLGDYAFLKKEILKPAINYAYERGFLTRMETRILRRAAGKGVLQAADLKDIFAGKLPQEVSRQIARIKSRGLLASENKGARTYVIRFQDNFLLQSVIEAVTSSPQSEV